MNSTQLLDTILSIIRTIKDDPKKLQKLHDFMANEICEESEEDQVPQVPEKYQALVKEAADWLAAGMICFINPETLELATIPSGVMDEFEWDDDEELRENEFDDYADFRKDMNRIKKEWSKVVRIEQPESSDSFGFMERFAHSVSDVRLQNALINALNHSKPFRNFNATIHNSSARQAWFDFRQSCLEKYIFDEMSSELNNDSAE